MPSRDFQHTTSARPAEIRRPGDTELGCALHGWFLRGLTVSPDRLAIRIGRQELTYTELHNHALALAGNLLPDGAERPRAVGVLADRTRERYIGILAALYAGATVVPLSPDFPVERTAAMVRAAALDVIISDEPSASRLAQLGREVPGIRMLLPEGPERLPAGVTASRAHRAFALSAPRPVQASDVAYILFTSGSTGRPKGVQITHQNIDHFLRLNQERYRLTPDDVLSQTFDTTFDLAMFDLFMAWGAGAKLVSTPPLAYAALPGWVRQEGVTLWFSVPSAIALVRRLGGLTPTSMPTLRWSLFCGEPLAGPDASDWQAAAPNSIVENLYGPTELTVACSAYRWSDAESPGHCVNEIAPIGDLYPGLSGLLLGEDETIGGTTGELCVTGPQMFPGYLDRADDLGRFVEHDGRTWYRTGDLVAQAAEGHLLYLGRVDHQVKIRGYRVELPEIESIMRRFPGVEQSVAVVTSLDGKHEIAVFYTGAELPTDDVWRSMARILPAFMVPRRIWHVSELPLNANRKIDRKALIAQAEHRALAEGVMLRLPRFDEED